MLRFMGGGMPDPGIRFQIFEPGRLVGKYYQIVDNIKWSHDITCSVDATEKTIRNSVEFEDFRRDHFTVRNRIMNILILNTRDRINKQKNVFLFFISGAQNLSTCA